MEPSLPDKLPISTAFCISITQFSQGIQNALPLTVSVYMVQRFLEQAAQHSTADSITDSTNHHATAATVSRLTGLLNACMSFAMFLTAFAWGKISDVIGRKPVVVAGNVSMMASVVMFGASGSISMAAATRFAGGLVNGVIGALKTIIGESCSADGQATAMGYLSLAWGLGGIIGPFFGGVLADPCKHLSEGHVLCGDGGAFASRPYLLPCIVVGCISGIAAVANTMLLPETLTHRHRVGGGDGGEGGYTRIHNNDTDDTHDNNDAFNTNDTNGTYDTFEEEKEEGKDGTGKTSGQRDSDTTSIYTSTSYHSNDAAGQQMNGGGVRHDKHSTAQPKQHSNQSTRAAAIELTMVDHDHRLTMVDHVVDHDGRSTAMQTQQRGRQLHGHDNIHTHDNNNTHHDNDDDNDEEEDNEQAHLLSTPTPHPTPPSRFFPRLLSRRNMSVQGLYTIHPRSMPGMDPHTPHPTQWYHSPSVCYALATYALIAFLHRLSDELVPLYAAAHVQAGGLGWSAQSLAPSLSFGGAVLMVFALVGYPAVQQRLGVLGCARLGLLLTVPSCVLAFPMATLLSSHAAQQVMFFAGAAARAVVGILAFTSSIVAVNLCSPRGQMGVVNGVGQSASAFMRAAAPACAGMLWSAVMRLPVVGVRSFAAFSVVGGVALLAWAVSGRVELPESKQAGGEGRRH